MISFKEALKNGFKKLDYGIDRGNLNVIGADIDDSYSFKFKDGKNNYELCFEKLLWDQQYYVALYKNDSLMTDKVIIKPGK